MIKVYVAIVRKFLNKDLTRILGNIFSQIESLTDKSLDQDTVDVPSLDCLKNTLNKIRCTMMGFFMD